MNQVWLKGLGTKRRDGESSTRERGERAANYDNATVSLLLCLQLGNATSRLEWTVDQHATGTLHASLKELE